MPNSQDLGPNADLIGAPDGRDRLETPALVLDLPAFERNLVRMAASAAGRGMALRPHAKTHKSVEIARRQIAAGALGVSCTVLREAEIMVAGCIPGVLITSPVVTPTHIKRLIAIARRAGAGNLMVVCDHPANAEALSAAAASLGFPLGILVDFSSGYHRTGVATEADAVALAAAVEALPHVELRGLQAYAGNIQHIEDRAARAARAAGLREAVTRIIAAAAVEGLRLEIVSGAGTGTHDMDMAPFTELQPGSYLFGDAQYAPVLRDGLASQPFEIALFAQASVVSVNAADYVTIDAGVKSLATDGPLPLVARGVEGEATYAFFGDEHGRIYAPNRPGLGAKIELVTPHCDPTVNLHDWLHVVDGDRLVAVWRIDARGH
ncbi:alanine racemase [Beijerinckia sp. L45]|uniref:alanine racemase n=1 Tax=Beijerinckia sp. L45 TaxID=1641855 RepID=UPI00131C69E6|nr:alanine racemase [Beijerinckia sp. L45]